MCFTMGINGVLHCYHSQVIITNGLSNNSSFAPVQTWQRAELSVRMPWEAPEPFFSSYLGQGQPYQTRGPRGLLSPSALASLLEKKGSHLSLLSSTSSPRLPPFGPQHSTFPVGVCKARITLRPQLVRCQKH